MITWLRSFLLTRVVRIVNPLLGRRLLLISTCVLSLVDVLDRVVRLPLTRLAGRRRKDRRVRLARYLVVVKVNEVYRQVLTLTDRVLLVLIRCRSIRRMV